MSYDYYYVLDDDGNPKEEPDIIKWGVWFGATERHIGEDKIGDVMVSTVFLGLNHNFGTGEPVLWETMIFGGVHDEYQERYFSKDDAMVGHRKAVELVRGL